MRGTQTVVAMVVVVLISSCGVGSDASVRNANGPLTYEQFLSTVYVEPTGEFISNGDELFETEADLRQFFDEYLSTGASRSVSQGLCIATSGGRDVKWSATQARNLTYCVSTSFGTAHYQATVSAMAAATSAWEQVSNVKYVHATAQDSNCTATNNNVIFNVVPVNVHGQYLARSFFPNTTRRSRNINIDNTSFTTSGQPTLTGILRHELGHTLGFRHEHTRPEAGACFEDNNWRALTTYDSASVMHYPQCNGTGDWSLTLTTRDAAGAHSAYP